jgi:Asp-tRNA(Asn)/Glu-tRNA(Gln) amidotransferase A subunit family amidase
MNEITGQSIAALAAGMAAGRYASAEVVQVCLDRIGDVDPQVQAFVAVLGDRVREAAAQRDAERRVGRVRGPLHGVPVAIKDLMTVCGMVMTAGSTMLSREPATRDAAVVRRLREAGALS